VRDVPAACAFRQRISIALDDAKRHLQHSMSQMKEYADRRRRPAPDYSVGQEVLLSTKNIRFRGPYSSKLLPKWIGPFTVVAKVGKAAYRLKLLGNMRIHDVFHVSLLKPYVSGHGAPPPPILSVEGDLEYEIERIIDHRVHRGHATQYRVRWKGYSAEHDTWEPMSNLRNCRELVQQYQRSLHDVAA
jgi:hypothetical protein